MTDQAVGETVARVTRKGGVVVEEQSEQEAVPIPAVGPGPHIEIGVAVGETIGLPGYSSLRIDVSIKLPARPANMEATYEIARKWALKKLRSLREELQTPESAPTQARRR